MERLRSETQTQAAIICTLQESNELLELDLAEGREKAPEVQMALRELTQSKQAAEDRSSALQEKLERYEEYAAERVGELEEEVRKLEAGNWRQAGCKRLRPSHQALFEARSQDWVNERRKLKMRIEEASEFERLAKEDDMICQCCMVRVKRVKMDCGHAMCLRCAKNLEVRVVPKVALVTWGERHPVEEVLGEDTGFALDRGLKWLGLPLLVRSCWRLRRN